MVAPADAGGSKGGRTSVGMSRETLGSPRFSADVEEVLAWPLQAASFQQLYERHSRWAQPCDLRAFLDTGTGAL